MEKIENLSQAFEYVNSRYVFNETNYPGFDKLNPDQQLLFAINHSNYHLVKNLFNLLDRESSQFSLQDDLYKASAIKTLVNILKLAEVLGIPKESFVAIEPASYDAYYSHLPLGTLAKDFLRSFITKLETADHNGKHDLAELRGIFEKSWAKIISAKSLFPQDEDFTLIDAYRLIPDYMKRT